MICSNRCFGTSDGHNSCLLFSREYPFFPRSRKVVKCTIESPCTKTFPDISRCAISKTQCCVYLFVCFPFVGCQYYPCSGYDASFVDTCCYEFVELLLFCVRQFDMMGIPVLNNAIAIARSRDKLRAMQLLTKKDIDVPKTVCARTPDSVDAALGFIGGTPAIVKLHQGTQGIGTMIADTPQAATSLLETLWAMGQDIILQEYIAESKGRDYRVLVVGGRVIAAMRRQAKKGEFRSNLHRGGLGVRVDLPKQYRLAAIAAAKVMGLEVAGVDMLQGKDGPKILEINSSPGLEGIERTSGTDVAGAIIAHAEKFLARRRSRRSKSDPAFDGERRATRIRPLELARTSPPPKAPKRARASS